MKLNSSSKQIRPEQTENTICHVLYLNNDDLQMKMSSFHSVSSFSSLIVGSFLFIFSQLSERLTQVQTLSPDPPVPVGPFPAPLSSPWSF